VGVVLEWDYLSRLVLYCQAQFMQAHSVAGFEGCTLRCFQDAFCCVLLFMEAQFAIGMSTFVLIEVFADFTIMSATIHSAWHINWHVDCFHVILDAFSG